MWNNRNLFWSWHYFFAAKGKIDKMLELDDPADVQAGIAKTSRGRIKIAKSKCTTLACTNGIYENDYLAESERRIHGARKNRPATQDTKSSIGLVVSELQAKLQAMKSQFREIRSRWSDTHSTSLYSFLTCSLHGLKNFETKWFHFLVANLNAISCWHLDWYLAAPHFSFESGPAREFDIRIMPRGPRGPDGPPGLQCFTPPSQRNWCISCFNFSAFSRHNFITLG